MSKNTPKTRPQQPRQTLSDVRKQFIHDLITRAESLTLDRIITQARGTCTRAEVAKAVDALTVEGSVFVRLAGEPQRPMPRYAWSLRQIGVLRHGVAFRPPLPARPSGLFVAH